MGENLTEEGGLFSWIQYEVTVAAKGIINGLSSIQNDGADFGPDSIDLGYPSKTSGIAEAMASVQFSPEYKCQVSLISKGSTFYYVSEGVSLVSNVIISGGSTLEKSVIYASEVCRSDNIVILSGQVSGVTIANITFISCTTSFSSTTLSCIDLSQSHSDTYNCIINVEVVGWFRWDVIDLTGNDNSIVINLEVTVHTTGNPFVCDARSVPLIFNSSFVKL